MVDDYIYTPLVSWQMSSLRTLKATKSTAENLAYTLHRMSRDAPRYPIYNVTNFPHARGYYKGRTKETTAAAACIPTTLPAALLLYLYFTHAHLFT